MVEGDAHLAKCERELVFIGVVYPELNAGHPVQERDDDHGDEVNEGEVFAHNRPVPPYLSALVQGRSSDKTETYKTFQKLKR
jgi:hypothetical protein